MKNVHETNATRIIFDKISFLEGVDKFVLITAVYGAINSQMDTLLRQRRLSFFLKLSVAVGITKALDLWFLSEEGKVIISEIVREWDKEDLIKFWHEMKKMGEENLPSSQYAIKSNSSALQHSFRG